MAGASRAPFGEAAAALVEEFKPAVVSFHFGLPAAPLLARVRAAGARILSSATTVDEALWLQAQGVDAIIAQGLEAGGHRGSFLSSDLSLQQGTFALLPQVVRAVRVPVIAAGGIADARGVAAALALGRGRRAGRHRLPAVPRGDHQRLAPRRAAGRGRAPHGIDQPVHRPAGARHRQPR